MSKSFVWIDSTWATDPEGKPIVILFGRDPETKEVVKLPIGGVTPYFYVLLDEWNTMNDVNDSPDAISCFGDPLKKVRCNLPSEIPDYRKLFTKTFEADIPFDIRYTVDNRIFYTFDENGKPSTPVNGFLPRIGYWDIEVRAPKDIMPDPEHPRFPVVMFSLYDSYTDEVTVMSLKGHEVDTSRIERDIREKYNWRISLRHIICQTEQLLYLTFTKLVKICNFDVMTAWNGDKFDNGYTVNRGRVINVSLQDLSRLERKAVNDRKWTGRVLVDMMKLFKVWSKPMGKMPFGLKYVAKRFCNFTYDDQGANIDKLMEHGQWQDLVDYSARDVIAMAMIDRTINLFSFYENIRRVMGVKLNDCTSNSIMIESLLMKKGIKPMPTREYSDDDESIDGATVLKPTPGIHRMVGTVDAKALYPTIIIMHDISPDIDKMIPKTIVELMEEREKLRRLRMSGNADKFIKNSETAIKYAVNAFYGYMAFRGARLFKKELAAKVTRNGRMIIKSIKGKLEENNLPVVYGDTDSVFAEGITTPEFGIEMEGKLNLYLSDWAVENGVKREFAPTVKFEKLYRQILFKFKSPTSTKRKAKFNVEPAKKRYAGHLIWKDGFVVDQMDYTGLETNRSDSAMVTRDCMVNFLEALLREDDLPKAKKIVKTTFNDVSKGKLKINIVGIPKGISDPNAPDEGSSNGAWLRGMRNATKLMGTRWSEEPKPYLLRCTVPYKEICILDDEETIPTITIEGTSPPKRVPAYEVDWPLMAEYVVKKKMEPLLLSIGCTWEEVVKNQSSLEAFGFGV
jgi:DNA polymerase I